MPRLSENTAPPGKDRPRQPAAPETPEESLKVARQALERLRRYLKATAPDDGGGAGHRSA